MRLGARRIEVDDDVCRVLSQLVTDSADGQRAVVNLEGVATRASDASEALGAVLILCTATKRSDRRADSLREEEPHVNATQVERRGLSVAFAPRSAPVSV
jgi:hypothetical protein